MASPAQIIANIANAQHSTGPVTAQGKARSAANATKFGFYAKQAVLLTDDDQRIFDALAESYKAELKPKSPIENTLFNQIIPAAWNLQRANCIEANLALTESADPLLSTSRLIDRIHTFLNRTERSFLKLVSEFRKLKSETAPPKPIVRNKPKSKIPVSHKVAPSAFIRTISPLYTRSEPKVGRNEPLPLQIRPEIQAVLFAKRTQSKFFLIWYSGQRGQGSLF